MFDDKKSNLEGANEIMSPNQKSRLLKKINKSKYLFRLSHLQNVKIAKMNEWYVNSCN